MGVWVAMGKRKGPYNAEYPVGSHVRIVDRPKLVAFRESWKYHHKLEDQQLLYSGLSALVEEVSFYHGGDELYSLKGIPGIWHEECLEPEFPSD